MKRIRRLLTRPPATASAISQLAAAIDRLTAATTALTESVRTANNRQTG